MNVDMECIILGVIPHDFQHVTASGGPEDIGRTSMKAVYLWATPHCHWEVTFNRSRSIRILHQAAPVCSTRVPHTHSSVERTPCTTNIIDLPSILSNHKWAENSRERTCANEITRINQRIWWRASNPNWPGFRLHTKDYSCNYAC